MKGKSNDWGKEHWMKECGGSGGSRMMPRRRFVTHLATLAVEDTPVWNNPAVGDPLEFTLSYNQSDWGGTPLDMGHVGPRWMHNWRSEILVSSSTTWSPWTPGNLIAPSSVAIHHRSVSLLSRTGGVQ